MAGPSVAQTENGSGRGPPVRAAVRRADPMMTRLTYLRKVAGLQRRLLTLALILAWLATPAGPHAAPPAPSARLGRHAAPAQRARWTRQAPLAQRARSARQ